MDIRSLLLSLVSCLLPLVSSAEAPRPNVLFFLVDDLGWADLGCYGSTLHETPHIDRLAASGLRFTDAYTAASICSPTRAAIMTGKHPVRVNITDWIPGRTPPKDSKLITPQDIHQLPLEETTIGEAFKQHGYATYYTGKWHLGGEGFSPDKQGFDTYYDPHKDSSKGSPGKGKTKRRKHGTLEITAETIKFIKSQVAKPHSPNHSITNNQSPFFAYVSYYDVHTPIIPVKERLAHYQDKVAKLGPAPEPIIEHDGQSRPRQDNAAYATMVEAIDESVGAILKTLEELKIADQTIVVFYSDNGGLCTKRSPGPTSNLPLRAGKGWLYEGGIRVPLIIRAPGHPSATTHYEVTSMDLYPTLLSLAGLPAKQDQHLDGQDFSLIVKGAKVKRGPRPLYWHYPHYHGSSWTPGAAIRDGNWKLVEFYHYGGHELYNLGKDPGETKDLSQSHSEVAARLRKQLHTWQKDLNAGLPTPR